MAILGNYMKFEPLRSLAYGDITTSYVAIGDTPTIDSINQWIITNATDQLLFFSFNGIDDHIVLFSNTHFVNDITSNKSTNHLFLGAGEYIYVKYSGTEPTKGAVYFSTMYGTVKGTANNTVL